ncbi:MAG: hypothetical protein LH660_06125, partial [Phormidesmis sp. CAN_BIN36]|nr:hypothetical protein [Phormidesmis sp. CAN_BIN36]
MSVSPNDSSQPQRSPGEILTETVEPVSADLHDLHALAEKTARHPLSISSEVEQVGSVEPPELPTVERILLRPLDNSVATSTKTNRARKSMGKPHSAKAYRWSR